jgi:N-acetylglutamate synthase-like GNAT family acetyltransferase
MFTLRSATRQDAAAIRRLIYQTGINPTALDWHRFVLAVDEQGRMAGIGQVKPHRDGTCEMASIAVIAAYRGQGVARLVIEGLLAQYSPPLYLTCRETLQPFYEKFGFRVVAAEELPPYFRRILHIFGIYRRLTRFPDSLLVMRRES